MALASAPRSCALCGRPIGTVVDATEKYDDSGEYVTWFKEHYECDCGATGTLEVHQGDEHRSSYSGSLFNEAL